MKSSYPSNVCVLLAILLSCVVSTNSYRVVLAQNVLYCNGKLVAGPDRCLFNTTFSLICIPLVVYVFLMYVLTCNSATYDHRAR
jgi:hypothetical protein